MERISPRCGIFIAMIHELWSAVMAAIDRSLSPAAVSGYPADSARFDRVVTLLLVWLTVGLFVDGYAHNHGAVDDTFFTPFHALLYSGLLAIGLFLGITQYRNIGRGYAFSRALPYGYGRSLIGVALFFAGGGFDFVWHSLFGFEASISALLSPAHLLLATAGFLIMSGPLRAAWRRREADIHWSSLLPVVLLVVTLLMTFFTQFANPFTQGWILVRGTSGSNSWRTDVMGVSMILLPTAITMGVLLFALRRWRLPTGTVTFILTVNAAAMMFLNWGEMRFFWQLLLAAPLAGIVGDVLLRRLKPGRDNLLAWRMFAFVVPLVLYLVYFVVLITRIGTWWEVHKWLGVTFLAAFVGVLLSYLATPPALPEGVELP
jgi:hypothetical protein